MNNITETQREEIEKAVTAISKEYIPRHVIESAIRAGPDQYPTLALMNQRQLRTTITQVMNGSYPAWSNTNRGVVWQIP